MKLWKKNYQLNKLVESYTVGNDYLLDQALVKYDCRASIAHANMLAQIGILKVPEAHKLIKELENIIILDEKGKFKILPEQEDCHTAIENHLTKKLGDLGKKIHTARSRNDQVLTALRLYYKDRLKDSMRETGNLADEFNAFAKRHKTVKMPGYTHTRKAMPMPVSMWATAFTDALKDDVKLLEAAFSLVDQSPLGTGAGFGLPLDTKRNFTARSLGFKKIQDNPVYAQNSRGKFESTILHALTQVMADLNRLASDLIIFSLPELGYFDLPVEFCTGSSIMPQKKNPDVLELLRAKYHAVLACELQVKNTYANLISGYNRDIQLTKEPLMKGFDIAESSLAVACEVIKNLEVNKENCEKGLTPEVFATEEVYELVKQGVPFRDAYRQIAKKY